MDSADILIIGGGIAGLSAGAQLARHGRVVILEAEEALGYHSSGRSATFSHFGIGNALVRALTALSRPFFLTAEGGALARRSPALFVATQDTRDALEQLGREMSVFTDSLHEADDAEMLRLFPPLRLSGDAIVAGLVYPEGLRLDSDAMLQSYARRIRQAGGAVVNGQRIERVEQSGDRWHVTSERGASWCAPVLVNAAGAWADQVAAHAGVAPLGLKPTRRTIIVVDAPQGEDVRSWPFVKTALDDFYILPEFGRLMASPVDEIECHACDAQPEDYDVALAAWKTQRYTTLPVERIVHRWAGLRTFTSDRTPAIGYAPDASGFFWLAGQGGFGLQTAPAIAEAVEALITGSAWPRSLADAGVAVEDLAPVRLG